MRVGQLWYGWAPRGVEGVNVRQVVAGSGQLGDPANGVTQLALPWCGYTSQPACGWIERDGIGVAFRRTPTGQDAAGREGAFFVHALIWQAGTFPASLLAGLWDADIWVLEPPAEPPDKLTPIQAAEQLGLSTPVAIDDLAVRAALAAHLENLAAGRRSSLALAPDAAIAYAAAIASILPARFGLPAFSTFEESPRELEYDIVASLEPHRHFAAIAPDARPGPEWTTAAGILLDARDGDASAGDVVATFAERADDLAHFASDLGQFAARETSQTPDAHLGRVTLAASDPRLLSRMLARFGIAEIAAGIADGDGVAGGVLRGAAHLGWGRAVFDALEPELERRAPRDGIPIIARVATATTDAAAVGRLAAEVGEAWQRQGALHGLEPELAHRFLRLLVGTSSTSAVQELLDTRGAAARITADEELPQAWRGRAAGAEPGLIPGESLTALLGTSPEAAEQFARRVTDSGLATLAVVLEQTSPERGIRVIELVGRGLTEDRHCDLALPVVQRLLPPECYPALARHAPSAARLDARWGHARLDAFTEHVLATRASSSAMPQLLATQIPHSGDERFVAWGAALRALEALPASWTRNAQLAEAARAAVSLAESDRDAAFELIVDRAADGFGVERYGWGVAMHALVQVAGEPSSDLADRIGRAALRGSRQLPREFALWTITWVAEALDNGSLSGRDLHDQPLDHVLTRLAPIDVDVLTARFSGHRRGSPGRRWLRYNRDKLAERFGGR